VVTLMLFWPRFDRHGALAAMITGSMMTILWKLSPFDAFISHRFISWVLALTAGFLISKKKAAG
jgi:Na+/proline symporter